MPTVNVTVGTTWTSIQSGEQERINVQPRVSRCEIFIGTSLPAATAIGVVINPEDFRNVDLETGEELYARSLKDTVTLAVTT